MHDATFEAMAIADLRACVNDPRVETLYDLVDRLLDRARSRQAEHIHMGLVLIPADCGRALLTHAKVVRETVEVGR